MNFLLFVRVDDDHHFFAEQPHEFHIQCMPMKIGVKQAQQEV